MFWLEVRTCGAYFWSAAYKAAYNNDHAWSLSSILVSRDSYRSARGVIEC